MLECMSFNEVDEIAFIGCKVNAQLYIDALLDYL